MTKEQSNKVLALYQAFMHAVLAEIAPDDNNICKAAELISAALSVLEPDDEYEQELTMKLDLVFYRLAGY